jgi:hypothetical protein
VNAAHSRGPVGPVVRRSHSSRVAFRSRSKVTEWMGKALVDGQRLGVGQWNGVKRPGVSEVWGVGGEGWRSV